MLAIAKVGLLAVIVSWGFVSGRGDLSNFAPFVAQHHGSGPLVAGVIGGLMNAFFSFGGWWDLSKMTGELREPGRTLPRAFLFGIAIVTCVYILVSAVFLYLVPIDQIAGDRAFAAQVGKVLFGRTGEVVFSGVVIVAVLGSLASIIMGAPRVR